MTFFDDHPRLRSCCKCNLFCIGAIISLVIISGFLIPPIKQDTDELMKNQWIVYYDKKIGDNIQVYSFDGTTETNLVNDPAYNYWWIKVVKNQTKFLVYRTPLGSGLNSYWDADLMIFNIDGTGGQVLIPNGAFGWKMQGVAKWSPDGKYLLVAAYCKDSDRNDLQERWRLVVLDSDGKNPRIVSTNLWDHADPNWSPDGKQIVYVSYPDATKTNNNNNFEIYVANLDETNWELKNITRLTNDNDYCFDPEWSPDGKWIAYSRGRYLLTPWKIDLYKIAPDGTNETRILSDARSNGVPSWTPDSKRLYFHTVGLYQSFSIASCDAINGGDKSLIVFSEKGEYSTPSVFNAL
jgi:Tol biopolymer transport system component